MAHPATRHTLAVASLLALLTAAGTGTSAAPAAQDGPLASAPVTTAAAAQGASHDGVVEAVRQTVIAAQVAGAVVALDVKAGDVVKSGQVLLRLDARAALQNAAAGAAQVQAARAAQEAAAREFERQKQLFAKSYISQAALDRAEEQYRTTQAQANAQLASAAAASTQSGFYTVRAPYAGVVSDVAVVLGDMAMPGRALLTVYDPAALRVSVPVPQTIAPRLQAASSLQIELPATTVSRVTPVKMQLLPTADPATHTLELRLDLPAGLAGVAPGTFARVWLPDAGAADGRLFVPASAIVRRAEFNGLYVIGANGQPLLRQVRLGRAQGDRVEVLSGVSAGERVALDPQAAARTH